MNGRLQHLLSVLSLGLCAAMVGGCAVGAGSEDTSEAALDSLIDGDGDGESDVEPNDAEPGQGDDAAIQAARNAARYAPTRNGQTWGQGEPPPIPWHEKTQGSEGNSEPNAVDETPHPPAPASPSDGR